MKTRPQFYGALLLAIFLAASSLELRAAERTIYQEELAKMYAADPLSTRAVCAGWNAVVGVKMENELTKKVIFSEARRHMLILRNTFTRAQSDQLVSELMAQIQAEYNNGTLSWIDLVGAAEACGEI